MWSKEIRIPALGMLAWKIKIEQISNSVEMAQWSPRLPYKRKVASSIPANYQYLLKVSGDQKDLTELLAALIRNTNIKKLREAEKALEKSQQAVSWLL